MKILLVKSCRDKLFYKVYSRLHKQYGQIDVLLKKDMCLELECHSRIEYETFRLSKTILQSELGFLRDVKFNKVFFVVPNGSFDLKEYKNIYSFTKLLNTKDIFFIDDRLSEQPLKSWTQFCRLIFLAWLFRFSVKLAVFLVCWFAGLAKKLTPKVIVERARL